ncbi:toprim domain-containing protein [Oscillospiraceae bacterium OttesenSCG-928-G22]|nr:toprim domain-containing protein [Oscillospiraceae bacterium OttesenSCG-928-G22]
MADFGLDNDDAGKNATSKLEEKLQKLNIPYVIGNISGEGKDPNEVLVRNRAAFIQAVHDTMQLAPPLYKLPSRSAIWKTRRRGGSRGFKRKSPRAPCCAACQPGFRGLITRLRVDFLKDSTYLAPPPR